MLVPAQLVAAIVTVYSSLYSRMKMAIAWTLVVVEVERWIAPEPTRVTV